LDEDVQEGLDEDVQAGDLDEYIEVIGADT
jgi:hypothetical protein